MATVARTAAGCRLTADAIRDVCARPAALLALADDVPGGAVTCPAERQQAVADGVARALELALRLEAGDEPQRGDLPLLEEAERRLWEPLAPETARLLRQAGADGLLAYLVVDGATRREAWRLDTQRRRAERPAPLSPEVAEEVARDPVDLTRFRIDVERTVADTARRTGLPDDLVYEVVAREVSYVDAGRRAGRTPNGLWMAIARVRGDWRDVAERGRAAGLGGGVLVRTADRFDLSVRRAIRWRLVGGVVAAVLLIGALGAVLVASQLSGTPSSARPPVEPAPDVGSPAGEGPYGPIGRILAIEAAAKLLGDAGGPKAPAAGSSNGAPAASRSAPSATPSASHPASVPAIAAAPTSCGLGTAALACR